jgi:hypothetical protein
MTNAPIGFHSHTHTYRPSINAYRQAGSMQKQDIREIWQCFWDVLSVLQSAVCLAYFSILKMKTVHSSETSPNFYQTAWRDIPEDSIRQKDICLTCRIRNFRKYILIKGYKLVLNE